MLYKVKASYKYQAEDVDELAFEVGEVINVVEYEDPEDQVLAKALPKKFFFSLYNFTYLQEEGWLMGLKETTGQRGMFPANFTRPI